MTIDRLIQIRQCIAEADVFEIVIVIVGDSLGADVLGRLTTSTHGGTDSPTTAIRRVYDLSGYRNRPCFVDNLLRTRSVSNCWSLTSSCGSLAQ